MSKKPTFLTFITDLQNMESRAHKLGLVATARKINSAVQRAGWEQANKDVFSIAARSPPPMAEDMIEKAAKAMCVSQLYAGVWDRLHEGAQETYRTNARAALLAALDPEDEALVARVLADCEGKPRDDFTAIVRMVIASVSKLAQGERSSQEQVREKDKG